LTFPKNERPSYESLFLSLTEKYGPPTGNPEGTDTLVWIIEPDGRLRPSIGKLDERAHRKEKIGSGRAAIPAVQENAPSAEVHHDFVSNLALCSGGNWRASCGNAVVAVNFTKFIVPPGDAVVSQMVVSLWSAGLAKQDTEERKKLSDTILEAEKNRPVEKAKIKL
jgi:hypothetical protein